MLNWGIGLVKDWTGKDKNKGKDQTYKDQDKEQGLDLQGEEQGLQFGP